MGRRGNSMSILSTAMGAASGMTGTATIVSSIIDALDSERVGIHAVWTGTPAGNFKVQCSDDDPQKPGSADSTGPNVTNWTDLPSGEGGATVAAGGAAGSATWGIGQAAHRFYRLSYTNTGSTGTVTVARATTKGAA